MLPLIPIGFGLYLPSYFLLISIGFSVGVVFFMARLRAADLSENLGLTAALIVMGSGFIGSRLFHIVFEHPNRYLEHPSKIIAIHEGGFVFYGGALLAAVLSLAYLKFKNQNLGPWLDAFAPVFPIVYAIGRFATLLSGSGYGRPLDAWWAISYPPGSEAPPGVLLHPTPIYSMIWAGWIWLVLRWSENRRAQFALFTKPGSLFALLVIFYALGRIVIEQYREDDRGALITGWSISSWISLALLLVSMQWLWLTRRPNHVDAQN